MKKLKQIKFDANLIGKEGIVIKQRNGQEIEVFASKVSIKLNESYPIHGIDKNREVLTFTLNGLEIKDHESNEDLIMYKEVEEITLYVVKCDYPNFFGIAYTQHEQAVKHVGGRDIEIIKFKEVPNEL